MELQPQFRPFAIPEGVDVLDMCRMQRSGWPLSPNTFAGFFVDLAQRGLLDIHEVSEPDERIGYAITPREQLSSASLSGGEAAMLEALGIDRVGSQSWHMPLPPSVQAMRHTKQSQRRESTLGIATRAVDESFYERGYHRDGSELDKARQKVKRINKVAFFAIAATTVAGGWWGYTATAGDWRYTLLGMATGASTTLTPFHYWLFPRYDQKAWHAEQSLPTEKGEQKINETSQLSRQIQEAIERKRAVAAEEVLAVLPYAAAVNRHQDWLDLATRQSALPKLPSWFHVLNPVEQSSAPAALGRFLAYAAGAALQPGEIDPAAKQKKELKRLMASKGDLDDPFNRFNESVDVLGENLSQ